ncbi:MAG: pilus assembly protein CpaF [Planctomycetota bacterium]|jgi:pilus assembly protein CpaF
MGTRQAKRIRANDEREALKSRVHRRLIDSLDLPQAQKLPEANLRTECFRQIDRLISEENAPLTTVEKKALVQEVIDEIFGLGPIEHLLRDPQISDILVNGPDSVYVERSGVLVKSEITFTDDDHVLRIIRRIAARVGRRIDESSPMLDARLDDGSRVNAIIPPLALNGPCVSIRRFVGGVLSLDDLVDIGSLDRRMADFLKGAVQAKLNIIISGGTGSGKTTLLNALSRWIPEGERILTIEDSAELKLQRDHVVTLEARPPNIEGAGEVSLRALLKNALRMRPDRIIIGEVRGEEAIDMLQAMNTGHEGSMTTIHSNSVDDANSRLVNMVKMCGVEYPVSAIREQISSTLDLIIQTSRTTGGVRRVTQISEVRGISPSPTGRVMLEDIFKFDQKGLDAQNKAFGHFTSPEGAPKILSKMLLEGVALPDSTFNDSLGI